MKWYKITEKSPPANTHVLTYSPDIDGTPYRILPTYVKCGDVTHWTFLEPPKE